MGFDEQDVGMLLEAARNFRTNDYVRGAAQFTDTTNAELLIKEYGDSIRFCPNWKKWLVWDGRRWEVDTMCQIDVLVKKTIRKMYAAAPGIENLMMRVDFENHIKKSEALRRRYAMRDAAAVEERVLISNEALDSHSHLFNVQNGTIDLDSLSFREHRRDDLLTKCSRFTYDESARCPCWDRFLLQVMNNDAELVRFVQKAMGYCLTGDVSEQVMFILWGAGANGKSTFLNVLMNLMGDYSIGASTETFMKKSGDAMSNDIARLRGMRLVATTETEQGRRLREPLVKQITGQDRLTARFLYGEFFDFVPTFKIFMATNHKPVIKGSDYGIWRRIRLIPFNVIIPPELRDRCLTTKLETESAGILNWLLQGCELWKKEGLKSPASVEEATREYQEDMDTIGQFVKDCCVVDAGGYLRIANRLLYASFTKWCNANNERLCSQKMLAMRLQEKGFVRGHDSRERYWLGLTLRE